ncbi:ankyrin repeat-containing domain protein, partial [Baffinella frigidus]
PGMMNAANREMQIALWAAIWRSDLIEVRQLLSEGADIEDRDGLGADTNARGGPLHWAARDGRGAVVGLLLEHGPDVKAKDKNGRTPEDLANARGHLQIAATLN